MISDNMVRTFLELITKAGFGYKNSRSVQQGFYTAGIEELKSYKAPTDSSLTHDELFKLYQSVADLHDYSANEEEKILYMLRSLKYKPDEVDARVSYVNSMYRFIKSNRDYIGLREQRILLDEFIKMKEFVSMKFPRDTQIAQKCSLLIEDVSHPNSRTSTDEFLNFFKKWTYVNRKFRSDEQALDYASQLIYKIMNSPDSTY